MMAKEKICAEISMNSHLTYDSTKSKCKCSKKWVETSAAALIQVNDSYHIKFSNKKKVCEHPIPGVGFGYMKRKDEDEDHKVDIFHVDMPEQPRLSLRFKKSQKAIIDSLKKEMKVYSYTVMDILQGNLQPCHIHITSRFFCMISIDSNTMIHKRSIRTMDITIDSHEAADDRILLDQNYRNVSFRITDIDSRDSVNLKFRTAHIQDIYRALLVFMKPAHVTNRLSLDDFTSEDTSLRSVNRYSSCRPMIQGGQRRDPVTKEEVLTSEIYEKIDLMEHENRHSRFLPPPIECNQFKSSKKQARARLYENVNNSEEGESDYVKVTLYGQEKPTVISCRDLHSSIADVPKKEQEMEKRLELSYCVFANKAILSDVWLLVIIFTRGGDIAFDKLKAREEACGRHLVAHSVSVKTNNDLQVSLDIRSPGFELLSDEEQLLLYEDLNELSHTSWITLESEIRSTDDEFNQRQFRAKLSVAPRGSATVVIKNIFDTFQLPVHKQLRSMDRQSLLPSVSSHPDIIFPLPAVERLKFCEYLNINNVLGKDWRLFAAEMGLNTHQIYVIESGSCSKAEEVLRFIEMSFPEKCNYPFIKNILLKMKRMDLVDILVKCNEINAIETIDDMP